MKSVAILNVSLQQIGRFVFLLSVAFLLIFLVLPKPAVRSQEQMPDYRNPKLSVDVRVADLLKRMTTDEKVAQLVCLWMQRPEVKEPGIFRRIAATSLRKKLALF